MGYMFAFSATIFFILVTLGNTLWERGAIFLLDFYATPHSPLIWSVPGGTNILAGAIHMLGVDIGSKVTFIAILISACILSLLFTHEISRRMKLPTSKYVILLAMAFFLWNPFAYERMMTQPFVYAGIISVWFTLYFLMEYERLRSMKSIFGVALASSLALFLFPHALYMLLLLFLCFTAVFARKKRDFFMLLGVACTAFALNSIWIIPLAQRIAPLAQEMQWGVENYTAFQWNALAPLDASMTHFLLYGFWAERYETHFMNPSSYSPFWYLWGGVWLSCSIIGLLLFGYRFREKKWMYICFILALVSLTLWIGMSTPFTASILSWWYEYLPFFSGYRESQKWIGVCMIIVGIGSISCFIYLFSRLRHMLYTSYLFLVISLIVLLIWSPWAILGYRWQLKTTIFPSAYETLRNELREKEYRGTVLVLPWHMYLQCRFTPMASVLNPIGGMLAPIPLIFPDNIEMEWLSTNSVNPTSQKITQFLETHDRVILDAIGVDNILLMKHCADAVRYSWLRNVCDAKRETEEYVFYECSR